MSNTKVKNEQTEKTIKLTRKKTSGEEYSIEFSKITQAEEQLLNRYFPEPNHVPSPNEKASKTNLNNNYSFNEYHMPTKGRYTIDTLDSDYFQTCLNHTKEKFDKLNSFAATLPETTIFGNFANDKTYISSVDLLMDASYEREHRDEIIEREIIPRLGNCQYILDIGVGNGELSRLIDAHCSFVTAIDNKQESLDNLPHIMGNGQNLVDKIKGSILDIDIPKKGYDFIVLSHSLYYMGEEDRIELIDKLYNLLGVKGRILIIYNNNGDREKLADYFNGKNQGFSKTTAHILEKYTDKYFYQSPEVIKANNLETMLHIAGVILDDADTTATKEELSQYIEGNLFQDGIYEIEMTQNIVLIGNTRE